MKKRGPEDVRVERQSRGRTAVEVGEDWGCVEEWGAGLGHRGTGVTSLMDDIISP